LICEKNWIFSHPLWAILFYIFVSKEVPLTYLHFLIIFGELPLLLSATLIYLLESWIIGSAPTYIPILFFFNISPNYSLFHLLRC
jgi:hypothetical protein